MAILLKIKLFPSAKITFVLTKEKEINKLDFKPGQMDLLVFMSIDLSQLLLVKDEVKLSTTKKCLF